MTRALTALFLIVNLSACSWSRDDSPCEGDGCQLLEQKSANKTWYCTGSEDGEHWKCEEKSVQPPAGRTSGSSS